MTDFQIGWRASEALSQREHQQRERRAADRAQAERDRQVTEEANQRRQDQHYAEQARRQNEYEAGQRRAAAERERRAQRALAKANKKTETFVALANVFRTVGEAYSAQPSGSAEQSRRRIEQRTEQLLRESKQRVAAKVEQLRRERAAEDKRVEQRRRESEQRSATDERKRRAQTALATETFSALAKANQMPPNVDGIGLHRKIFKRIESAGGEHIELPSDFPTDIPIYPGSVPLDHSRPGVNGLVGVAVFDTDAGPERARRHLSNALTNEGWSIRSNFMTSEGIRLIRAGKDGREITMTILKYGEATKITNWYRMSGPVRS